MSDIVRRPDLENQPVSFPGYLCNTIAPWYPVQTVGGTISAQPYKADVRAQTGRDHAKLAEITDNVLEAQDVVYVTSEIRQRVPMSYSQIKGFGGIDGAETAAARMAKRSFMNEAEIAIANKLLNVDSPIDGTSDLVGTIETEVGKLRDKALGKVALVLSNRNFAKLKKDEGVKDRMKNTGVGVYGLDPRKITEEQLAAIFAVDTVLVGQDACWYRGLDAVDRPNVGLVILPTEDVEPAEEPQWARSIVYDFGGVDNLYIIEQYFDNNRDANVVQAKGLVDFKVLNSALATAIAIDEADESESESN